MDLGYLAAFAGGVLALLSPCSALLLPAFFGCAFQRGSTVVARTGVFYLGLVTTLVPLGAGASMLTRLFLQRRDVVVTVAGVTIIALGVVQLAGGGFAIDAVSRRLGGLRIGSGLSVFALGTMYGVAGFCSGPILGSVLTIAAASGRPAYGATLLAVYALGMTVPLLVLALLWDRFDLGRRRWLRGRSITLGRWRTHTTSLASGLLFIALGTLFLVFDGSSGLPGVVSAGTEQRAQTWLQARLPARLDLVVLPAVLAVVVLVAVFSWRRRAAPDHHG